VAVAEPVSANSIALDMRGSRIPPITPPGAGSEATWMNPPRRTHLVQDRDTRCSAYGGELF